MYNVFILIYLIYQENVSIFNPETNDLNLYHFIRNYFFKACKMFDFVNLTREVLCNTFPSYSDPPPLLPTNLLIQPSPISCHLPSSKFVRVGTFHQLKKVKVSLELFYML